MFVIPISESFATLLTVFLFLLNFLFSTFFVSFYFVLCLFVCFLLWAPQLFYKIIWVEDTFFFFLQRKFDFNYYRPLETLLARDPFKCRTWDIFAPPHDKSFRCTPCKNRLVSTLVEFPSCSAENWIKFPCITGEVRAEKFTLSSRFHREGNLWSIVLGRRNFQYTAHIESAQIFVFSFPSHKAFYTPPCSIKTLETEKDSASLFAFWMSSPT